MPVPAEVLSLELLGGYSTESICQRESLTICCPCPFDKSMSVDLRKSKGRRVPEKAESHRISSSINLSCEMYFRILLEITPRFFDCLSPIGRFRIFPKYGNFWSKFTEWVRSISLKIVSVEFYVN